MFFPLDGPPPPPKYKMRMRNKWLISGHGRIGGGGGDKSVYGGALLVHVYTGGGAWTKNLMNK